MDDSKKEIFELQKEVHNQIKSSIEKFSYYIMGLSVSSLAFVIYQIKDDKIDFPKILLLGAVLFWAFSIYFGIHFIRRQQHGLTLTYFRYDNLKNTFQLTKDDPAKIIIAEKSFNKKFEEVSDKSKRNYKYQLNGFFIAVIFYIIWHAIEMYQNTILSYC